MSATNTLGPFAADSWKEDDGDVLWWCWEDGAWVGEAPYVGSPLDMGHAVEIRASGLDAPSARIQVGGWPGYHTHWTRIIMPSSPDTDAKP